MKTTAGLILFTLLVLSAAAAHAAIGDELFKLTDSDAAVNDQFGWSVRISGNTAIVGAYLDDDGGIQSGSAYLFDVTTGNQLAKLTASDAAAFDRFGYSVGISGNTALVGAPFDDDGVHNSGSAYLFDATIPEPGSHLLAALAAGGLLAWRRR